MIQKLKDRSQFEPKVQVIKEGSQSERADFRSTGLQKFFKINVRNNLKFHRKTPVLEFLFNKVAGPQYCSSENCKIFKNTFFYRTAPVAASKVKLVLSKESETKTRVTVSYKYQIQLKKK